jgi:hypothetical protein
LKKVFETLTIGLLVFQGCQNAKTRNTDNEIRVDSSIHSENHLHDFNIFLGAFKKAVLESDSVALKSMTRFPLKTRGDLDTDPIIEYAEKDFIKIFNDFLQRPTGTNINNLNESQLELLTKTNYLEPAESHRIGDMVFEKVDDKWNLVFIYYWEIKE